ncbi:MAG: phosphatase PAP2 family protein [Pseudomonadota bacterium]
MNDAVVAWLRDALPWPQFFFWVTDAGGPLGWWLLLQFILLFAGTQRGLRIAWLACLAIWSNTVLKYLLVAPRPFWIDGGVEALRVTDGFGMPSGHAQGATALLVGCALLAARGRRALPWVLALGAAMLIAVSRVYLGVHSVAQVIWGFALGLALSLVLWRYLPALEAWAQARSLPARVGAIAALSAAAAAGLWAAWRRAANVDLPSEWAANVAATAARLGEPLEAGAFEPADPGAIALALLLLGYLLLALVARQRGHRVAAGGQSMALTVVAAVAINLVLFAALNALGTGLLLWLLFQPLLAVWLPLRWFGGADAPAAASGAAR